MREVEHQITETKKTNYDKLTRPVCAFITFEEEDAYSSELEKYAFLEYYRYYISEKGSYYFTGPLQCFCTSVGAIGLGKFDNSDYTVVYNGTTYSEPICEQSSLDYNENYALSNAV